MISRTLLKTITSMLVELGRDVYVSDFEAPFLQASATFYQAESQEYVSQSSASDYMRKAEARLHTRTSPRLPASPPRLAYAFCAPPHASGRSVAPQARLSEEADRVSYYLDPSTEPRLREVAERELIAKHMRALAEMEHTGVVAIRPHTPCTAHTVRLHLGALLIWWAVCGDIHRWR